MHGQVAIAEALGERGRLATFFGRNWPKVAVAWEPKAKKKDNVLEDAWKPKRILWGFPLDTPIEKLQEFRAVDLTIALEGWRAVVSTIIEETDDYAAKESKWRAAVGEGQEREAKLHAGLRVLLDMPEATVKDVVEEFVRRSEESGEEAFARSVVARIDAAVKAAEKAG